MRAIPELTDPSVGFRNFAYLAWKSLGLPTPAPIQLDVADYLANGPDRRIIEAMRGFGKSYLTATYAAWRLYCEPDATVLCISAAQYRSREFIRLTRQLLSSMEVCNWMIPGDHDRDGADRFDVGCRTVVSKDPSLAAYGITSMITGTHVDLIICDDVETPDNSRTVEGRERLLQKLTELENILNPGGQIVMLGTPQTEDSIYNKLASHYQLRRWPARAPELSDEKRMDSIAPFISDQLMQGTMATNQPTYPEYYPEEELLQRESVMGPSTFALQFLLDTTLSDQDRYPLKLAHFIVHDCAYAEVGPRRIHWGTSEPCRDIPSVGIGRDGFFRAMYTDPTHEPYQKTVMYIDPSGRGADETGYCVAKLLNGTVFIPEAGGLTGGHDEETMKRLGEIANRHQVKRVIVESNFGDGMYAKLLSPVLGRICGGVSLEEERVGGQQKELRLIESLEPPMAAHRLVIDPVVARNQALMTQLTRLTRERGCLKHDDQIDAMAGAVRQFAQSMSLDVEGAVKRVEEAERNSAVREFEDSWKSGGMGRMVARGGMPEGFSTPMSQVPRARPGGWGKSRRPLRRR